MPVIDIQFRIMGKLIPVDHGYHLFSAISDIVPELHRHANIAIHPVAGHLAGNRSLAIGERSCLTVRLPSEQIISVLPLAGKTLKLDGYSVQIGVPQARALIPSARLYSRLVVIKGFMDPDAFLEAAQRQLKDKEIKARPSLVKQSRIAEINQGKPGGTHSLYLRRTIRIHDKEVVGFALRVEELTAEESIRLQEEGIGGRRHFGCGIFVPDRR
jgi:CRISPR-associated protein Cas6